MDPLLTAAKVSRKLQLPNTALLRAMRAGHITADFTAGREFLFRPENVGKIRAALAKSGVSFSEK